MYSLEKVEKVEKSCTSQCPGFLQLPISAIGFSPNWVILEPTGLYSHFKDGCPTHLETGNLEHLTITRIDRMTTSEEKLEDAVHTGGVQCRCSECERLKSIEDKWICRLGSFHQNGLNTRDEIKSIDSRVSHNLKLFCTFNRLCILV